MTFFLNNKGSPTQGQISHYSYIFFKTGRSKTYPIVPFWEDQYRKANLLHLITLLPLKLCSAQGTGTHVLEWSPVYVLLVYMYNILLIRSPDLVIAFIIRDLNS